MALVSWTILSDTSDIGTSVPQVVAAFTKRCAVCYDIAGQPQTSVLWTWHSKCLPCSGDLQESPQPCHPQCGCSLGATSSTVLAGILTRLGAVGCIGNPVLGNLQSTLLGFNVRGQHGDNIPNKGGEMGLVPLNDAFRYQQIAVIAVLWDCL